MADEEQGFTFVDKRHAQTTNADTAAENAVLPEDGNQDPPVAASEMDAELESGSAREGSPDIYAVLGYCISLLAGQAWQKLGLMADPATGEASADLVQAKIAIDAIGDLARPLESGPNHAVPENLRRELSTLLKDLRLNFVAQRSANFGNDR